MSEDGKIIDALRTSINRHSPVPYYAQVKEALIERIENGEWKSGNLLPGEPELCRLFGVSRTVIRQALKDMEYQGLIVRRKGVGTYIAEPKIGESLVQKLTGFHQDMVARGHTPITQVLKHQVVPASGKVAIRLEITPGTPVVEIERLRFVDEEPIVLVTTWIPVSLCPALADADLTNQSLYEFLDRECSIRIARGHRTLEAVLANDREAQLLGIAKGAPLMLLDSTSYIENGVPVEHYHAIHRGDRSRFEVELLQFDS